MKLIGKVAIVTGASKGIGYGVADYLMMHGADVAICARNSADIEQAAATLRSKHPERMAVAVTADVSNAADLEGLFTIAENDLGPVSIVVNNAGISTLAAIEDITEDDWETMIAVNLKSAFLGTKTGIKRMKAKGTAGVIINIGSVETFITTRGNAHYAAAKAGIEKLTEVAALEAGRYGIRVNTVAPGIIMTPLVESHMNPGFEAAWHRSFAIDRMGEPADIAKAVVFLASDYANWITGINLLVDGGTHLRGLPDYIDHLLTDSH